MTKLYAVLSENASLHSQSADNLLLDMVHQLRNLQEKVHVLENQIAYLKNNQTGNFLNIQHEQ